MNRKVVALIGVAILVLLVARTHRTPPVPPPALPVIAGIWTADAGNGAFSETGDYNGEHLALLLPAGAARFRLALNDDAARLLPSGATPFHVTFDDNASFGFVGHNGAGGAVADVPGDQIGGFTRHLIHGGNAVVSLDDDQAVAPWVFPLDGARMTAAALAANMRAAGVRGLPSPWNAMAVRPAGQWNASGRLDDAAGAVGISLSGLFFVLAAIYFAPSIVAYGRHSAFSWLVLLVNVVFGWTGIGWLGALLLALFSPTRGQAVYSNGPWGVGRNRRN